MMKPRLLAIVALCTSCATYAQIGYISGGSLGGSIGYAKSLADDSAIRVQYSQGQFHKSTEFTDGGVAYPIDGDFKLKSLALFTDYYPEPGIATRATLGVLFSDSRYSFSGSNAVIGTAAVATYSGEIRLSKSPALYLGVGYSTRPRSAKGIGFLADFGVAFQKPEISINAPGATDADVAIQISKYGETLRVLKTLPILSLGISFSF